LFGLNILVAQNTYTMNQAVDGYIHQAPVEFQPKLQELRELILSLVPEDTEEIISYGMPTYKRKTNLLHFAAQKNHLGIYPGAAALESVSTAPYASSKGALHLPWDKPLPEDLIAELIHFNIENTVNPWQKYAHQWKEASALMSELMDRTPLKKEKKWGADVYTLDGKNVIGWGGFKAFFSIWFYNGVFLEDPLKVLIAAGETKALRQWRFTQYSEMNPDQILSYIYEAMDKSHLKVPKGTAPAPDIPEELIAAFDDDPKARAAFEALTPGKRKEYLVYLVEAKQSTTRLKRLEKILPLIIAGKGLNDKYKR
jgi:uncharacterized protein YdeI (YjbR/CyaY-like superfamily)